MTSLIQLGQEVEQVDLVLGKAINALLQLVNGHGLAAMHLVKQQLVPGTEVELLASIASHRWVQLLWEGVLVGLQLAEQVGGDSDIVTPAKR